MALLRESMHLRGEARIQFGPGFESDLLSAASDFAEVYGRDGVAPRGQVREMVAQSPFIPDDVLFYPIREDAVFVFQEVTDDD